MGSDDLELSLSSDEQATNDETSANMQVKKKLADAVENSWFVGLNSQFEFVITKNYTSDEKELWMSKDGADGRTKWKLRNTETFTVTEVYEAVGGILVEVNPDAFLPSSSDEEGGSTEESDDEEEDATGNGKKGAKGMKFKANAFSKKPKAKAKSGAKSGMKK